MRHSSYRGGYLYKEGIERFVNQYEWVIRGIVLAAIILFYVADRIIRTSWWWSFCVLALYLILMIYSIGDRDKLLDNKFTVFVSRISFEMFLAHMFVFRILEKIGTLYHFGRGCMGYLVTYICVVVILIIGVTIFKKAEEKIFNRLMTTT